MADDSELGHRRLEVRLHELLVVDHALPLASSALQKGSGGQYRAHYMFLDISEITYGVTSERLVGLEAHLSGFGYRGVGLRAGGAAVNAEGDTNTLEQDFEEDLGVEGEWRAVEGNGLVPGDESIGASNRVRCEQVDELSGREATILHAGKDAVDVVLRLRDGTVTGREGCVRATGKELETGRTRAVRAGR